MVSRAHSGDSFTQVPFLSFPASMPKPSTLPSPLLERNCLANWRRPSWLQHCSNRMSAHHMPQNQKNVTPHAKKAPELQQVFLTTCHQILEFQQHSPDHMPSNLRICSFFSFTIMPPSIAAQSDVRRSSQKSSRTFHMKHMLACPWGLCHPCIHGGQSVLGHEPIHLLILQNYCEHYSPW